MEQELPTSEVFSVPPHLSEVAHVKDMETYKKLYEESINGNYPSVCCKN